MRITGPSHQFEGMWLRDRSQLSRCRLKDRLHTTNQSQVKNKVDY